MYGTDTILRLTGLIYDAAVDSGKWVLFLDELGRTINGHTLNLSTIDAANGASMTVIANADPAFLQQYHAHYADQDPWFVAAKRAGVLRPGMADMGERFVAPSALVKTEFHNDLGQRYEVVGGISALVGIDGTITALSMSQHSFSQFGDAELALIRHLLPHLRRALTVHQRIATAEAMTTSAASVLDRIPHSVFFLSRAGRLVHANRAGADLLRRRDGLAADRGELRAGTPAQTATLRAAIAAALQGPDRLTDQVEPVTILARAAGRRSLTLVAIPVNPAGTWKFPDGVAVALIVTDPDLIGAPPVETMRFILGVTPSEAQLASCLAEGLSLKESAERLGIEIETARKRLKVIFQKTDTHRQADLVRLALLSSPPSGKA